MSSVMKTKTSLFVLHYARFALLLQNGSRTPACRWHPRAYRAMREESPGSIGHPTSENGSSRRRQAYAEENNRRPKDGKGEKVV